jgi:hypothetical protein
MVRVLNRMIAPNPAQRFCSYDELLSELEKAYNILTGKEDVDPAARRRKTRWLIGATALTLAAISAVVLVFVRKHERATATTAASAQVRQMVVAELERQAAQARRQLLLNHYNVAGAAFAKVAMGATDKQPLYDWARLQQGLAAMIGRDTSQARQALQDVENSGQLGFAKKDEDLARFFIGTAKTLLAPGVVPASQRLGKDTSTYSVFALLLFALKDIDQTDAQDAVPLLEQFVAAQPVQKYDWIAELKPIAQKYLDDCRLYATWKSRLKGEGSGADLAASLANVRDLRKKLRMRTAMSEELEWEEKSLAALASDQQNKKSSSRQQQRKQIVNVEMPAWNAAIANYKKQIALYDFAAASAAVKNAKLTDPSLEQSQEATIKKAQWLVDWKDKLIADINRAQFSGAITDISGVQYGGISSATPAQFVLKAPYGTVTLRWTKFARKTLLAISSSFIQPSAPDAADRQWLCAVFAAATGQAESARQLAETASKTKPEYRDQISLLFSPASAFH